MKKDYVTPEMIINLFINADIMTASPDPWGGEEGGEYGESGEGGG